MKLKHVCSIFLLCTLLLLTCSPLSVFATEPSVYDYSALFQQVKDAGDNLTEVSPALSGAFLGDPVAFINALAQEEQTMWDTVGNAIVTCNTGKGNDLEFLQFVLEAFASDGFIHPGRDAFLSILMRFHPDVTGADDELIAALFRAKRCSDGISSDKLGIYIYELFLDDPVRLLHLITEEDEAFQKEMISTIDYQNWNPDDQYSATLSSLSSHPELSEAELAFVAELKEKLKAKITPAETETPVKPTAPVEVTEATEPAATNPIIAEPATPQPSNVQNILLILIAAIVLVGFGAVALKNKKKTENCT